MDLNYMLAWFVGASAGLGFFTILHRHGRSIPGWLGVHGLVLAAVVALSLVAPAVAGFVGAGLWVPLVLLPTLGNRLIGRLTAQQRYTRARGVARLVGLLHPWDGWLDVPRLLAAQEHMLAGRRPQARELLLILADGRGRSAREARLQLLRMDGRWAEIAAMIEASGDRARTLRQPDILSVYGRALGELGRTDDLVRVHDEFVEPLGALVGPRWIATARLVLAAFTGQVPQARALLASPQVRMPASVAAFWLATALQASGEHDAARELLLPLAEGGDPLVRAPARGRLERAVVPFDARARGVNLDAMVTRVEGPLAARGSLATPMPGAPAPRVTLALIGLNLGAFALEIPGGTTNEENLLALGALVAPSAYLEGQWWRVVTSAFLHYGTLHLVMNMVGLWYFGRFVEQVLGWRRTLLLYAVATPLAMTLIVVAADLSGETGWHPVVGASGGVMALVGAIVAILWHRWRRYRTPVAGRELALLLLMLAFSTTFDLVTPQISAVGHAAGATLGLVLGLLLNPKPEPTPIPR